MSIRAAQVADELKSTNCAVDSEEAQVQAVQAERGRLAAGNARTKVLQRYLMQSDRAAGEQ